MWSDLNSSSQLWEVFLLFAIPIGGGIPAGVILANKYGFSWVVMALTYLVSDIALAFVFEPIMRGFARLGRHSNVLAQFQTSLKQTTQRTLAHYGANPGPFLLIWIAFGVDPMTGRAAAMANGHGFMTGWAIAIAGDMIFFFLIMSSTLWLNDVLGDGTWAAVIIMVLMIGIPSLIRRVKALSSPSK